MTVGEVQAVGLVTEYVASMTGIHDAPKSILAEAEVKVNESEGDEQYPTRSPDGVSCADGPIGLRLRAGISPDAVADAGLAL